LCISSAHCFLDRLLLSPHPLSSVLACMLPAAVGPPKNKAFAAPPARP
jgi:hypothetical protein